MKYFMAGYIIKINTDNDAKNWFNCRSAWVNACSYQVIVAPAIYLCGMNLHWNQTNEILELPFFLGVVFKFSSLVLFGTSVTASFFTVRFYKITNIKLENIINFHRDFASVSKPGGDKKEDIYIKYTSFLPSILPYFDRFPQDWASFLNLSIYHLPIKNHTLVKMLYYKTLLSLINQGYGEASTHIDDRTLAISGSFTLSFTGSSSSTKKQKPPSMFRFYARRSL